MVEIVGTANNSTKDLPKLSVKNGAANNSNIQRKKVPSVSSFTTVDDEALETP